MKNTFIFLFALFFFAARLHAELPGSANAMWFDGTDDFISVPDNAAHKPAVSAEALPGKDNIVRYTTPPTCPPIRFVKQGATGSGVSWADASGDIQAMIDAAATCGGGEVWVASGTYKPVRRADATGTITPNDRDNAFVLRNNVKLFGGFAGTEATLSERVLNPASPGILSGDFNGNDQVTGSGSTLTFENNTENAFHVVISSGNNSTAVIDGFTVSGGFASGSGSITVNGISVFRPRGGGMYNGSSSPVISNCIFSKNSTLTTELSDGGGMFNTSSSPVISHSTFFLNFSRLGGGMMNVISSFPHISDCIFTGNLAAIDGGGMNNQNNASPTVSLCIFTGNAALNGGGGGMISLNNASPIVSDCIFTGNSGVQGGGMRNSTNSSATVSNCEFHNNTSSNNGGGMSNGGGTTSQITGCTFTGNSSVNGGALSNIQASPAISGSAFIGNTAFSLGGGIMNSNSSPVLTDNTYISNTALFGGGIYNNDASPTVTASTFSGNTVVSDGGGMYNFGSSSVGARRTAEIATPNSPATLNTPSAPEDGTGLMTGFAVDRDFADDTPRGRMLRLAASNPVVEGCTFTANFAGNVGGGMINNNSSPGITNSTFANNTAGSGAGLFNANNSTPSIDRCRFTGNTASGRRGGGIANVSSSPSVSNSLFADNSAALTGGGMLNENGSNPHIINSTFSANTAGLAGGGIRNTQSDPLITNVIIFGNSSGIEDSLSTPVVTFSLVQGGYPGEGNIDADPLFVNAAAGDYHLQGSSPAINSGSNTAAFHLGTDLDGEARIQQSIVDMGAFENEGVSSLTVTINQAPAQADPTSTLPIRFVVVFSEPVTDFSGSSDISLAGSTAVGVLNPVITGSGTTYEVTVFGPIFLSGTVVATVPANVAQNSSGLGNQASTSTDNTVQFNTPLITIAPAPGQANPTANSPVNFTVEFSGIPPVPFTSTQVSVGGTAGGSTAVVTGSGTTYNVAVSGMTQPGTVTVTLSANAGGLGLLGVTGPAVQFQMSESLTVTINQAIGQADPTMDSPINYTVVFSEPVTGFTAEDVVFTGSTQTSGLTAVVTGSGATYNVAVSGMTSDGVVVAGIPAGAAENGDGPGNTASGSTDNTVTFVGSCPALIGTASTNPTTCGESDGTITLGTTLPDGGEHDLSYRLDGEVNTLRVTVSDGTITLSDLGGGVYSDFVIDGGDCIHESEGEIILINPVAPASVITPDGPTELCEDDLVSLTAAPGASYLWSTGDTTRTIIVGAAATYSVTVTSAQSCKSEAEITVTEKICNLPPVAVCKPLVVLVANDDCYAVLTTEDLDGGSYDPNGDWTRHTLLNTDGIFRPGDYTVTYEVMDPKGAFSTCESRVQVADHTPPVARARDLILELNISGQVSISVADVDAGSYDHCGPVTLSLNRTTFDCSDLGNLQVRLTVTDAGGNVSEALSDIRIVDNTPPVISTTDLTLSLDENGRTSVTHESLITGISDNCGIWNVAVSQNEFTCEHVGENEVVITVEDVQGNRSTATVMVTIEDNTPPVVIAGDLTLYLAKDGKATLSTAQVDDGSKDNCGITHLSIDREEFDCKDLGEQTLTLTATDAAGNTSETTFTVIVLDTLAPVVLAKDITLYLDAAGQASLAPEDIDEGSSDNCGISDRSLQYATFDCANVGTQPVQYTVTDASGNSTTVVIRVTVSDIIAPEALAQNVVLELDGGGKATLSATDVDAGSSDNCGIAELSLSQTDFSCADLGSRRVTLTVKDVNGNQSTDRASVLITDPNGVCPCSYGVLAYGGITLRTNEVFAGGIGVISKGKKVKLRNTVINREGTFVKAPQSRFDNESEASIYIRGAAPTPESFRNNGYKDKKKEKVGKGKSLTLATGRYGRIKAGKGATLTFSGGEVYIRSLKVKKNASLVFSATGTLLVRNDVKLGKNTALNTQGEQIRLYAGGRITAGNASEVRGILHSQGNLKTRGGSEITSLEGLFVANKIRGGRNTHWAGGGVLCTGNNEPEPVLASEKNKKSRLVEPVDAPAGLTDSDIRVSVWPNPAVERIAVEIESEASDGHLLLVDMQGNILLRKAYTGQQSRQEINLGKLPTGTYMLRVSSGGKEKTLRLFKEKR